MENDLLSEMDIQRFWSRRIAGQYQDEGTTADVLLENQLLFPPAQVQVEDGVVRKSRPSSPFRPSCSSRLDTLEDSWECQATSSSSNLIQEKEAPNRRRFKSKDEVSGIESLNGNHLSDIPCLYTVPRGEPHEMTAVGVCIDSRISPGFTYRIRTLSFTGKSRWLFGGDARELESVGRGYSRRITLKPLKGQFNSNPDFFWTDSNYEGFAFSILVVAPQDKFTLFDADHQAVGHLEITHIQGPQTELSQSVHSCSRVEKKVKVRALCKIDWFHDQENEQILPLSGICLSLRKSRGASKVIQIRDVKLGSHQGYTLRPGTCSSFRSRRVSGASISDVPTSYTIVGIENHHLPVIGTYVDERIVPGFHYRVQLGGCGKKMFGGHALRLKSLGRGYAKRITFSSDITCSTKEEHFWSDSHAEGFGFEISAVRPGMRFTIKAKDSESSLGHAYVFRDDCAPQTELHHSTLEGDSGPGILKRVQIDVNCIVSLDLSTKEDLEPHVMRVSGIATLFKPHAQAEANVVKIENIGMDSQLNLLFFNQWQEIVFYPHQNTQQN